MRMTTTEEEGQGRSIALERRGRRHNVGNREEGGEKDDGNRDRCERRVRWRAGAAQHRWNPKGLHFPTAWLVYL